MTVQYTAGRPLQANPDEFRPDPHKGYARYRPLGALIDFGSGMPMVIRHDDAQRLMNDPGTRQAETEVLEWRGIRSGALYDFYANTMLLSNPPRHAVRRAPVARTFAYKLVEAWRPRVRAIMHELIDKMQESDSSDFLAMIASPLPSRLIAEIIGAPGEDAPSFAKLVYTMSRGLGAFRDEEFPEIDAAAEKLNTYVADLVEGRREISNGEFLADYKSRVSEAGELSSAETLMQIVSLVIAGSDTTRFAMTAMVYLLMKHRDQWEELCRNPGLAAGAVREALRYEPPVGSLGRFVVDSVAVDGIELHKGTILQISLLSAQRDETVFNDPQKFDIHRNDHPRWSLTFGFGAHRCLGEALARAELEEALGVLCERLPGLKLAGPPPQFKGHVGIRGITPMHVAWQ